MSTETTPIDPLAAEGIAIEASQTTPSRPGKAPRPVWNVSAPTRWHDLMYALGAKRWRGRFSFWSDPTDEIREAIQTTAPCSYADRHEAARDRAAARADRRRDWQQRAERRQSAAFQAARNSVAAIPPGQPILVGHHSERAHRAALRRHDGAMRRGVEAGRTAEYHADRARAAETTADDDRSPAYIQRRIEDAAREVRKLDKRIGAGPNYSAVGMMHPHTNAPITRADIDAWYERLKAAREDEAGKLEYWRARLAAVGGVQHGPDTIKPGDYVLCRHAIARVVRTNRKTVSVRWDDGPLAGMDAKYPYAEVRQHYTAAAVAAAKAKAAAEVTS